MAVNNNIFHNLNIPLVLTRIILYLICTVILNKINVKLNKFKKVRFLDSEITTNSKIYSFRVPPSNKGNTAIGTHEEDISFP